MSCQYIAKFNRYKPDKLRINIQLQTRHKRYSFFLPVGKPWSCHHLHRGLQIIPAKAAQCVILLLKWPYISTIWLVIHNHVSPDLTLISLFSEIQRKEKGIHFWLALRFQWGDFSTPTEPSVLKFDFPVINSQSYFLFFLCWWNGILALVEPEPYDFRFSPDWRHDYQTPVSVKNTICYESLYT